MHQKSRAIYRVMWLHLTGHDFRLPLDTPKPLLVLRAGLTGETAYWVVAVLAFALLAVIFRRLAERLFDAGWAGLAAFVLVALGNSYVLPGPFLIGYWPLTYYTLLAAAGWCYLDRRHGAAFGLLGLSGLLRPESWAVAALVLAWTAAREPGRFRRRWLLSLAPPLLWAGFDVLLAGDPLHSFHTLQRYQAYLGVEGVGAGGYWSKVAADATGDFHGVLLAVGAAGLLASPALALTRDERRAHVLFLAVAATPLLGYWAVSAVTDVLVHVRFLSPALVVLYLYAVGLPLMAARRAGAGRPAWPLAADDDRPDARVVRPPARGPVTGAAALLAALAWTGSALWLGLGTGAWEETRRVARSRAGDHLARVQAATHLRAEWVEGGGRLLAGRSVDWLALELGPAASRRMHQFRAVAHEAWRLPALGRGTAVYVEGDVGGLGATFHFLGRDRTAARRGVLFRPARVLTAPDGGRLGVIHRFLTVPARGGGRATVLRGLPPALPGGPTAPAGG